MSQATTQLPTRKSFSTRSLVLVILLVGLGAGTAAYVLASASAAPATSSNQNGLNTYNGQWLGLRGAGPLGWETGHNGTFTSFRAVSAVTNVTVTGFNIVDSSHITVTLSYQGTGTAPAATIVVVAPGLSGSNTVSAGWSTPTTVSVHVIAQAASRLPQPAYEYWLCLSREHRGLATPQSKPPIFLETFRFSSGIGCEQAFIPDPR